MARCRFALHGAIEATVPLPPLPDDALDPAPLGPLRLVLEAHRLGYLSALVDAQGTVLSQHRSTHSLWTVQGDLVVSRLFDALDAMLMEARPRPIHPSLVRTVVLALEQPPSDLLATMLGDRYGWHDERLHIISRPEARHHALGRPIPALVALADLTLDAHVWLSHTDTPLATPAPADWPDLLPSLVRHACDAALDALYANRHSPLVSHLCAALNTPDADALADWLTQAHTPEELAAAAPAVAHAAHDGDATAQHLLERLGNVLARHIQLALHRLGAKQPTLFITGQALDLHPIVGQSLEQALCQAHLQVYFLQPSPSVLDGCLVYASASEHIRQRQTTYTKQEELV